MDRSVLTVLCVTYNQEAFIAQALESFVVQKTNFNFEVLVGDDASTDKTPQIIKEYAAKYPDIIKPILREKNIGASDNSYDLFTRVTSEYVAICDGDDYWIDDTKLQQQVDFLASNPDFSICFHPVKVIGKAKQTVFPNAKFRFNKDVFISQDLCHHNFMQTNSILYRWNFKNFNFSAEEFKTLIPGDWFLSLMHSKSGKIGYIDKVMAVYRKNDSGIWLKSTEDMDEHLRKYGFGVLNFYKKVMQEFEGYLSPFAVDAVENMLYIAGKNNNPEILKRLGTDYFDLYVAAVPHLEKRAMRIKRNFRHQFVNVVAKVLGLPKPYKKKG